MTRYLLKAKNLCFNTQPRGGGCDNTLSLALSDAGFNTQPRGGGCLILVSVSG